MMFLLPVIPFTVPAKTALFGSVKLAVTTPTDVTCTCVVSKVGPNAGPG